MNEDTVHLATRLIEDKIREGFMSADEVSRHVIERLEAETVAIERCDFSLEGLQDRISVLTNARVAEQEKIEAVWSEPTDCDRLDWLFHYLEVTGVAARQNFSCCSTCAPGETEHLLRSGPADRPFIGCVYYGKGEAENVADVGWLHLEYGTLNDAPEDVRRLGLRIMKAAVLAGLAPIWSGHPKERIRLKVDWRRRLITVCKLQPDGAPDLSNVGGSLYQKLGPWDDDQEGVELSPMPDYVKAALDEKKRKQEESDSLSGPIGISCPLPGCGGEIVRYVKPGQTVFGCGNNCAVGIFQDAPLKSGGSHAGTGHCPECHFLLVKTTSKYIKPPRINCLNVECYFSQEATDNDIAVEAPKISRR